MARKSGSPPSKFWERLTEAFKEQELPISQNGVAKLLDHTHGTVWGWYHGEWLPELETCRIAAAKGRVCVDWLITGRKPKYPISNDPVLSKILEICEDLDEDARKRILRAARGELIQKTVKTR